MNFFESSAEFDFTQAPLENLRGAKISMENLRGAKISVENLRV